MRAQDGVWMRRILKKALMAGLQGPLWLYRTGISPLIGPRCRYYPTCSHYMGEALTRHGPLRGLTLGLWRILRCHPWARGPLTDPVPERFDWREMFRYKRDTHHTFTE